MVGAEDRAVAELDAGDPLTLVGESGDLHADLELGAIVRRRLGVGLRDPPAAYLPLRGSVQRAENLGGDQRLGVDHLFGGQPAALNGRLCALAQRPDPPLLLLGESQA